MQVMQRQKKTENILKVGQNFITSYHSQWKNPWFENQAKFKDSAYVYA